MPARRAGSLAIWMATVDVLGRRRFAPLRAGGFPRWAAANVRARDRTRSLGMRGPWAGPPCVDFGDGLDHVIARRNEYGRCPGGRTPIRLVRVGRSGTTMP